MRPSLNLCTLLTDQCCPFVRQEAAALSEAQASNQALRVQLVEATSAFHHALCIAQTLLTEGAPCKHFVTFYVFIFGCQFTRFAVRVRFVSHHAV